MVSVFNRASIFCVVALASAAISQQSRPGPNPLLLPDWKSTVRRQVALGVSGVRVLESYARFELTDLNPDFQKTEPHVVWGLKHADGPLLEKVVLLLSDPQIGQTDQYILIDLGPKALQPIQQALPRLSPSARGAAYFVIGEIGGGRHSVSTMDTRTHPRTRLAHEAAAMLIDEFTTEPPKMQEQAAFWFQGMNAIQVIQLLENTSHSRQAQLRIDCAVAARSLNDPICVNLLLRLLEDPVPEVAQIAAVGMGFTPLRPHQRAKVSSALLRASKSSDGRVRHAAIAAAARLGFPWARSAAAKGIS